MAEPADRPNDEERDLAAVPVERRPGRAPRHRSSVSFGKTTKFMAQYAIAFDLDTKGMTTAGFTRSDITKVYQTEIPAALASCGFTAHPQGSLYHTESDADPISALMKLQGALKSLAPSFCKHVRRVHVFRMEEWSDVTPLISGSAAAGTPTPDEEVDEQDALDDMRDIVQKR